MDFKMTKDEAMKLALEALTRYVNEDEVCEGMPGNEPWVETKYMGQAAITALRKALTSVPDWASEAIEQPAPVAEPRKQEPVDSTQISKVWWDGEKLMAKPIPFVEFYKPAQRTWVNATTWRGLTDEERRQHNKEWYSDLGNIEFDAIEAKLKAKNSP